MKIDKNVRKRTNIYENGRKRMKTGEMYEKTQKQMKM